MVSKIGVKDLAASLALPSNNNSKKLRFHQTSSRVDLFVRSTPQNIEKLRAALRVAYQGDPSIDEISTADLLGDYPAVRYVPPPVIYISM